LLVGRGVNYIVIGKQDMATEKENKEQFDKIQQEQRDLDESYKQSLRNKKEREDNEEYLRELKDKL
jgi:hypothetical protein|tara:strand:- start:261 stop:458 length:198 start_codon:yes stop_codon:yes gene_type:complete